MVGRREEDVRERLGRIAMKLFAGGGHDRYTAADIAGDAGVTERTFFHHFADKREVLLDGGATIRAAMTKAIAAALAAFNPLDILFHAFAATVPLLGGNQAHSVPRQRLIAATPALAERELAKTAALGDALADALRARKVAELPARSGMAAFVHAIVGWLDDPTIDLRRRLETARSTLATLLAP